MLSYQHGFHAGNHADVLKHGVLLALLEHLLRKPKAVAYVETHAGAGEYDLTAREARRHREHETGIARVLDRDDAPAFVRRYAEAVRRFAGPGRLVRYPGSPRLAVDALRDDDPVDLFELHPAESRRLARAVGDRARLRVRQEDGLAGLAGVLPPASRRGLVLIDPSYEVKSEFRAVTEALAAAHRRFATGTYAIWYPVTSRERADRFARAVKATGIADLHRYELCIAPDDEADFGMTGSGMLVARPAWTLAGELREALPWLARVLGGEGARHRIEILNPERSPAR